jgi:hypothetical protein
MIIPDTDKYLSDNLYRDAMNGSIGVWKGIRDSDAEIETVIVCMLWRYRL